MRKPSSKSVAAVKTNTVELPENLDLTAATPLTEKILSLRGEPLVIDASKVDKLGAQCLQVLLSTVVTWKADMTPIEITKPSEGFEEGLRLMGLTLDGLMDKELAR